MKRLLAVAVVAFGMLAGCSADTLGAECSGKDDCDDGQVCVALAICAEPGHCTQSCEIPCAEDRTCKDGQSCQLRADTYICRN